MYADTIGAVAILEMEYSKGLQSGTYVVYLENQVFTGYDLRDADVLIYDYPVLIDQSAELYSNCEIFSGKGSLNIFGKNLHSISVMDICGRRVIEINSPDNDLTQIQLMSGIYLASVMLPDGSSVIRKVLIP